MDVHPTKNGINRYWSIPISLLTNEWLETPKLPIFSDPSWSWYRRLAESRLKRLSAQLLVSKGPGKMLEFTKKTWSKCRFSQRKHVFFKQKKGASTTEVGVSNSNKWENMAHDRWYSNVPPDGLSQDSEGTPFYLIMFQSSHFPTFSPLNRWPLRGKSTMQSLVKHPNDKMGCGDTMKYHEISIITHNLYTKHNIKHNIKYNYM